MSQTVTTYYAEENGVIIGASDKPLDHLWAGNPDVVFLTTEKIIAQDRSGNFVMVDTPEQAAALQVPTQEELNQQRTHEIYAELDRLDNAGRRATRAVTKALAKGLEPDAEDVDKLVALEAEADTLRGELHELQPPKPETEEV
jgi:hypothetical protein